MTDKIKRILLRDRSAGRNPFGRIGYFTFALILLFSSLPAVEAYADEPPPTEWDRTFGGTSTDVARFVRQTSDGGYIVVGHTSSSGAGGDDFWLVKTDSAGNRQWENTFGGTGTDLALSGQQTSDGGYIVAGYTRSFGAGESDVWLVKADSSGNKQWDKMFSGPLTGVDIAYSVQQTLDGGYIVAAYTSSFGAGQGDFWWIKTDSLGNIQWDKRSGSSDFNFAYSVQQTSDGGYIFAGNIRSFSGGLEDFWLVKTDSAGNRQWENTFGGTNEDVARHVRQTSDGGYVLTGTTASFGAGNYDIWLVKTDSSGNKQWDKTFGGTESDRAWSVQQTLDGGYIIAGDTRSFGAGQSDFWLLKTDSSGNTQWAKTFGGISSDNALSVQQISDRGYVIAGNSSSYGAGGEDAWLIKVAPPAPLAAPTGLTKISPDNNPLPAFKWNASANATSYEVKMDSGNWAGISSNLTYVQPTVLTQGSHTFSVRAKNSSDVSEAASLSFNVTVTADLANTRIAFTSMGDDVWVMNADGSNRTQLIDRPDQNQYPTWSPDGGKIAFYSNRDGNDEIYVMNADSSAQTRLTNNSAQDVGPVWSPDGTKIAFSSDHDGNFEIYLMNADGTGQARLTNNSAHDGGPAWSPDGTKIAFGSDRDGNYEIYVMNADGTGQARLTNNSAQDVHPAWSPDGTKLVFSRGADVAGGNWDIYLMNADGTGETRLTDDPGHDVQPTWSPDGSRIAFSSDRGGANWAAIYVMNADGSAVTLLDASWQNFGPAWSPFLLLPLSAPTSLTKISPDNNPLPAFKWSASANATSYEVKMDSGNWTDIGNRLTYVQPTVLSKGSHTFSMRAKDSTGASAAASLSFNVTVTADLANTRMAFMSDRDGNWEIYLMNPDGSNVTRLTNHPANDMQPAWSPDGSRIAFVSNGDGEQEIYVMNADGTGRTQLTNNNAEDWYPTFSADGRKIAFLSQRDGNREIYSMNADGTEQVNLTNHPADDDTPAWSSDGARIAFSSRRDGGDYNIYLMNPDGSGLTRLTTDPDTDAWPAWSPDDARIAFTRGSGAGQEIYLMTSNGTNEKRLTSNAQYSQHPDWSPDRNTIVFSQGPSTASEIFVMNADGSNLVRLTYNAASDAEPAWSPFLVSVPPTVTTNDADNIATTSVRLNGNLTALGTASTVNTSFQWGTSSGTYANETSFGAMTAAGPFNFNLTGLTANTTYYFRAKAVGDGTSIGLEKSFTTSVVTKRLVNLPASLKVWKLGAPNIDLSLTGQTEDTVAVIGPMVDSTKIPVVSLSLGFSQASGDIDFANQLTVDTDLVNGKAVFHRLSYPAGVSSAKTLYVKKLPQHDRVRVVPGASTMAEVYSGAPGSYVLTLVDSNLSVKTTLGGDEFWAISGLTGTGAMGEAANQSPVASFTYSPSSPSARQVVMVDASASSDADGSIANYSWDWGDGGNSSATTPTGLGHTYTAAGSYLVVLTVRDNLNATSSQAQTITVSAASQSSSPRVRSLPDISTWALIASGLPLLGLRAIFSWLRKPRRTHPDG